MCTPSHSSMFLYIQIKSLFFFLQLMRSLSVVLLFVLYLLLSIYLTNCSFLSYLRFLVSLTQCTYTWAASWQNQQCGCEPSKDSDQPGHPPSLIRVFPVRSMGSQGPKLCSCGQRRLWSDWANAQADLSLRWAHHHIVGFVMRRLTCCCTCLFLHFVSVNFCCLSCEILL